jgi:hypothetical protein
MNRLGFSEWGGGCFENLSGTYVCTQKYRKRPPRIIINKAVYGVSAVHVVYELKIKDDPNLRYNKVLPT